jgi:hypothetical protein
MRKAMMATSKAIIASTPPVDKDFKIYVTTVSMTKPSALYYYL